MFLMYCRDTEHFPLLLSKTKDNDPAFEKYSRFLFMLAKKFNAIRDCYQIAEFPMGGRDEIVDFEDASYYWLNCNIGKMEKLLPLLQTSDMSQCIVHDGLINILVLANCYLEDIFHDTIWK